MDNCSVTNAGYSCYRMQSGATLENSTGHYDSNSLTIDYGSPTRPRFMVGGKENVSFGHNSITIRDCVFTSVGQFARVVFDAPSGFRLTELNLENVTFDQRGASWNSYVDSLNERGWFKCDNIETVRFTNVEFLHDDPR